MTPEDRYTHLVIKAWRDYQVQIEPKVSKWYWKAISVLLTVVSFGRIKFLTNSHTTIGNRIGVAPSWKYSDYATKYEVLLHELEHVKQFKRAGFGNVWLGVFTFGFAYLFLPFPVGLAWFRMHAEKAAYEKSIRAVIQTRDVYTARTMKHWIISQFTSADYLWMWPFPKSLSKWFDDAVDRIAREEGKL